MAAMLYENGECYFSREYLMHIVDRVGGGDSFGGGLIYAMLKWLCTTGYDRIWRLQQAV